MNKEITRRTINGEKGWWIDTKEYGPIGPYDDKQQAKDTLVGLRKFDKHKDSPGYITIDPPKEENTDD